MTNKFKLDLGKKEEEHVIKSDLNQKIFIP
jgi:hypothetical protein